jgi:2-oxoacid:acceptor oxidoreductase gamma subunit (pyruvate/2-ketoisovalerate family)
MVEIRIHGRGGQGAVFAASILARALFEEGRWVQAFPHFGVERRGAPVAAFVRYDDHPIELRCHIYHPDYVIILDPTLATLPATIQGINKDGCVLVNSPGRPEDYEHMQGFRVATVDASTIALQHKLGSIASPIVNTAILGAFARFTGIVSLDSIIGGVCEIIKRKTEANIDAVQESYRRVILAGGADRAETTACGPRAV